MAARTYEEGILKSFILNPLGIKSKRINTKA